MLSLQLAKKSSPSPFRPFFQPLWPLSIDIFSSLDKDMIQTLGKIKANMKLMDQFYQQLLQETTESKNLFVLISSNAKSKENKTKTPVASIDGTSTENKAEAPVASINGKSTENKADTQGASIDGTSTENKAETPVASINGKSTENKAETPVASINVKSTENKAETPGASIDRTSRENKAETPGASINGKSRENKAETLVASINGKSRENKAETPGASIDGKSTENKAEIGLNVSNVKLAEGGLTVSVGVQDFTPQELTVKLVGRKLLVSGAKECKSEDGKGSFSYKCQIFRKEVDLPEDVRAEDLSCTVDEGKLQIEVSKKAAQERTVPIQHTALQAKTKTPVSGSSKDSRS